MTDWKRPGEGDSEIAAPAEEPDASTEAEQPSDGMESEEVVRTTGRTRPSNAVLLLGAILVLVIAQAVITWLTFDVTKQLRDQSAIANGLQRCLIQAQLNENSTTDPSGSAYKTAVQSCLNR